MIGGHADVRRRRDRGEGSRWDRPPRVPRLQDDVVHVWRASLSVTDGCGGRWWWTLAPEERARAARFRRRDDRKRFVTGRALLREILAGYLDEDPRALHFGYGPHGKPRLPDASGRDRLHFNVSHSHEMILYAIAGGRDVGVDVEYQRRELADARVAQRFFSELECASLRALPAGLWEESFFRCWTRKEAYVKATGRGLDVDLKSFAVSVAPGVPAAVVWAREDAEGGSSWSLRDLALDPGYIAALAVRGHGWRLERFSVD